MNQNPVNEPQDNALEVTEKTIADLGEALYVMNRERTRVRSEDWKTLFRQLQTMVTELVQHPFMKGDAEAEVRIDAILLASNFEELDEKVDRLAEYVAGKLAYNAALEGKEPDSDAAGQPALRTQTRPGSEAARLAVAQGPSGSDFEIDTRDDPTAKRRSVLRL